MVRRSRSDIEQLVLDAAVDLVRSDGLGTGAEGVTYTRVFRHLENTTGHRITRASVHERVWADQAAFQAAVRDRIAALPDPSSVGVGIKVEAVLAALEPSTPRPAALAAGVRGVDEVLVRSDERALRQARLVLKAALALASDDQRDAAEASVVAFRNGQRQREAALGRAYLHLVRELGGVVRSEGGMGEDEAIAVVAQAVDALREGLDLVGPFTGVDVSSDDGDAWPITSIVGYHLIRSLFVFPEESPVGASSAE